MTNALITFTNIVFSAALEMAHSPVGPWSQVETRASACAEAKTFSVPVDQPAAFFRLKLHDNGILPTPKRPEAYQQDGVRLTVQMPYACGTNGVQCRWYRNGVPIGSSGDGVFTDCPPPGQHLYQVQFVSTAGTSWLSDYISV